MLGWSAFQHNWFCGDTDAVGKTAVKVPSVGGSTTFDSNILEFTCNALDGTNFIVPTADAKVATINAAYADNGSGAIRVVTSAAHGFNVGDVVQISGVKTNDATLGAILADPAINNVSRANPTWTISAVSDSTHFDLTGSTYSGSHAFVASTGYAVRVTTALAITGGANAGGLVRLTTAAHLFTTGDVVTHHGLHAE